MSRNIFKISYSEVREIIGKTFGGMIYNGGVNSQDDILKILETLERLLDKDMLYLPNRLILEFLLKQRVMKSNFKSYRIKLTEEKLSKSMDNGLMNFIKRNENQCLVFLQEENYLENFNLEVPSDLNRVMNLVYSLTLEYFTSLKEHNLTISDSIDYIDNLKEELLRLLYIKRTQLQGEILTDKVEVKYSMLTGYKGIEILDKMFAKHIKEKFEENNLTKMKYIFDYGDFKKDRTEDKEYKKLFSWGIPNIDKNFAFYSSEITTMVSRPGLGKTNTAIDLAMKARLAGVDVIFIHGESSRKKVRDSMVTWYINYKTNKKINYKEVDMEDTPEEVKTLFQITAKELHDDESIGDIFFTKYTDVETYKEDIIREVETIEEKYRKKGQDGRSPGLLILDHINDMNSNGDKTTSGYLFSDKDKIDYLYRQTKELKEYLTLSYLYLAHPSSKAKDVMTKNMPPTSVTLTGNSSHGDQDSDTLIYLRDNPQLEEDRLYVMGFKKTREGDIMKLGETVLEKQFICSTVLYREEKQSLIQSDDYDILEEEGDFY